MKQLLGKAVTTRRFHPSLLATGLFSLSASIYAVSVTVGGANLTESPILASTYANVLKKNYIEANTRLSLGGRGIIIPALQSGEIDVVPEYLGALLNFYNGRTEATSQQNVNTKLAQVLPADFILLSPASTTSIATWMVRAETAKRYHLRILLDLEPVAPQLVIDGPPELAVRALGLPGLKRIYGLEFKAVKSLDMDRPLIRLTLNSGKIDVATVVSTQGNLAREKWVILKDDKHEQPSRNVMPLVCKTSLTPEIGAVLNEVSGKLDNTTLIALNQQVDLQHKDPAAVTERWVNANLSQH